VNADAAAFQPSHANDSGSNREQSTAFAVKRLVLTAADFGMLRTCERTFLVSATDGARFGSLPLDRPDENGMHRGPFSLALDLPMSHPLDAMGDTEEAVGASWDCIFRDLWRLWR